MLSPAPPLVLVVNDDRAIVRLLALLLAQHGYCTVSADAAQPALRLLKTFRPHLMILDLDLPGINGQAVLEQVRATPDLHDIPVLVLSTQYPDDEVGTLADAVHEKPFDLEKLLCAVRHLIAAPPLAWSEAPPLTPNQGPPRFLPLPRIWSSG